MSAESDFEDIEIGGMIEKDVKPLPNGGIPGSDVYALRVALYGPPRSRNDATPGSVLCIVPFALSRRPPSEWAEIFRTKWDKPQEFSTGKEWPGVARVEGDRVVLNGVTLDDVEQYHRKTLVWAVAETNKEYRMRKHQQEQRRVQEQSREEEFKRRVRDVAKDIKFD